MQRKEAQLRLDAFHIKVLKKLCFGRFFFDGPALLKSTDLDFFVPSLDGMALDA